MYLYVYPGYSVHTVYVYIYIHEGILFLVLSTLTPLEVFQESIFLRNNQLFEGLTRSRGLVSIHYKMGPYDHYKWSHEPKING